MEGNGKLEGGSFGADLTVAQSNNRQMKRQGLLLTFVPGVLL